MENQQTLEEKVLEEILKLQMTKDTKPMVELYSLVGSNSFFKILDLFNGQTITFPDKNYIQDTILLALCYLYRNIKGYEWDKIKQLLNKPDLNALSMAKKITSFSKYLEKMNEALKNG